jgi:FHA domain
MAVCPDGHSSDASDYCDVCGLSMGAPVGIPTSSSSGGAGFRTSAGSAAASAEPCPNCLLPRTDDPFCEGCGYDFATAVPIAVSAPATAPPAPASDPGATQPFTVDPTLGATQTYIDLDDELAAAEAAAQNPAPTAPTATISAPVATSVAPPAATAKWTVTVIADRAYYDAVVAEGEIDPNSYPFPPYCPERRFDLTGDTVRIGRASKSRGSVVEIDLTGPPTDPGISHLQGVFQATPDGGWTLLDPGSANGTVLNDDTAPIPENHPIPVEDGFRIHMGVWTTLTLVREP